MRRVLIASFVLGSARLAAAQPAEPSAPPPDTGAAAAKEVPLPPDTSAEKPVVTAVYDDGIRFESSDGDYEMRILFRNQMRFESLRPTESGSQFLNKFYIPRSRLQADGHVFGDANRYKLEFTFDDSGSYGFVKDMFIEHRVAPAPVWLRFGQWKRPFNRPEMVSDFASQFNERSIENDLAGGGRDLGIALHNDYEKSPPGVEWVIGMFNTFNGGADRPVIPIVCTTAATGTVTCINNRSTTFPLDFEPAIVARAGWNSPRAKGYSEADLEGGPLRYSVAAAYKIGLGNLAKHGQDSLADNLSHGLEVDWNVKSFGLSFSGAAVMMKVKNADVRYGVVVQPGYMIVPKHVEVAGRFALTTEPDHENIEAAAAFNYYVHGHHLKIASDAGILQTLGEDPITLRTDKPDVRVRIMAQLEI